MKWNCMQNINLTNAYKTKKKLTWCADTNSLYNNIKKKWWKCNQITNCTMVHEKYFVDLSGYLHVFLWVFDVKKKIMKKINVNIANDWR